MHQVPLQKMELKINNENLKTKNYIFSMYGVYEKVLFGLTPVLTTGSFVRMRA